MEYCPTIHLSGPIKLVMQPFFSKFSFGHFQMLFYGNSPCIFTIKVNKMRPNSIQSSPLPLQLSSGQSPFSHPGTCFRARRWRKLYIKLIPDYLSSIWRTILASLVFSSCLFALQLQLPPYSTTFLTASPQRRSNYYQFHPRQLSGNIWMVRPTP